MKEQVKIGQIIQFAEDFEITTFGGRKFNITSEDKALVVKNGIEWLSGDAKGIKQKVADIEIKGYDYENISELLFEKISNFCEYDLQEDEISNIKEEIEEFLIHLL